MKTTTIADVVSWLDATFHPEYQENYDNAGFLLGVGSTPYHGALVALDLTPEVIDEAVDLGHNLIVTHHPFIFSGIKRLTDRTETGRMVISLIRNNMAVYAAHTNLDNLPWGVSGILAEKLGLQHCSILKENEANIGSGIVGELPEPMSADAFLLRVKELTHQPAIRTSLHDPQKKIHRIALCGGAGAFLMREAIRKGADCFVTGEFHYHDYFENDGMLLAELGHYQSEASTIDLICQHLSASCPGLAIVRTSLNTNPICYDAR